MPCWPRFATCCRLQAVRPPDELALLVKTEALRLGFSAAGIAEAAPPASLDVLDQWLAAGFSAGMGYMRRSRALRADPGSLLPGARSVVAVAMDYGQQPPEGVKIARYALGRDYHKVLRGKLRALGRVLAAEGVASRACVDSAPILERELGHRAGLGWFGKNTMLIDSRRGSWFVIGLLLTDAAMTPDAPSVGGCGTCRACIDACPTGAIVQLGGVWQVDARRCVSALTIEHRGEFDAEQSRMVGEWTFGCDVCQEVCPFNQPRPSQPSRAAPTRESEFRARPWPSVGALAEIGEADWDELTRGTAVRRAGWQGLRRNARANLANRG